MKEKHQGYRTTNKEKKKAVEKVEYERVRWIRFSKDHEPISIPRADSKTLEYLR